MQSPKNWRTFFILLIPGILMAIMPPQEPHLLQKLELLWHGWLVNAMDWFDLILHSAPLAFALGYLGLLVYERVRGVGDRRP